MKKYIAPAVEIQQTQAFEMIALSLQSGNADSSEVLSREDVDIWADDVEE